MTGILDRCIDELRKHPWQTATSIAAAIGTTPANVNAVLGVNVSHKHARVTRRRNRHDQWEYALYHAQQ